MTAFALIPVARAGVIADAPPLATVAVRALDTLLTFAGSVGIVALVVVGITYLFAAAQGSDRLQQAAKKGVSAVVIGMVMVMGPLVVARLIAQMF